MTRGGSDSLAGRSNGIAEPAESPDETSDLVQEGIIDEQGDAPGERKARENESTDTMSQSRRGPGGPLEEVVEGVQFMAATVIGRGFGVGILSDAQKGFLAQTHEPGEQE